MYAQQPYSPGPRALLWREKGTNNVQELSSLANINGILLAYSIECRAEKAVGSCESRWWFERGEDGCRAAKVSIARIGRIPHTFGIQDVYLPDKHLHLN